MDETQTNNVIVLVLDSIRADHCSTYGYKRETTPELSAFAEDAYTFEHAYSTGSWTVPAHGSLFTGRLPTEHGAHADHKYLSQNADETLSGKLRKKGYHTACFSGNPWLTNEFGFDTGFDQIDHIRSKLPFDDAGDPRELNWYDNTFKTAYQAGQWILGDNPIKRTVNAVSLRLSNWTFPKGDRLNDVMIDWLDTDAGDDPFFLFANYMDGHEPYLLDEPYDKFLDETTGEELDINWNLGSLINPPKTDKTTIVDAYDSSLHYLDKTIGEFIAELNERGILDNTALVVLGDHGQCLGDHEYWGHGTFLYKELLHVPVIIRPPGGADESKRITRITSLTDVYDFILDLATGEFSPDQSTEVTRNAEIAACAESLGKHQDIAIPDDQYSTRGYRALYLPDVSGVHNLETDEYTLRSPDGSELQCDDREVELRNTEQELLDQMDRYEGKESERELEEKTRRQLEDLGYM
ncbi:sulfatase [Natrinema soli]|uniref:Sulfatase n=1 Tax=Natrinema soli TaxID=1930624 RepID=A0ABD5SP54_9EURY|nr:sulfatase [Natrinema soli]